MIKFIGIFLMFLSWAASSDGTSLSLVLWFLLGYFWFVAKESLATSCLPSAKKSERNTGEEDDSKST